MEQTSTNNQPHSPEYILSPLTLQRVAHHILSKKWNSSAYTLRDLDLPTENLVIITGDWNLHHPLWSAKDCPSDETTELVIDWLAEKGMTMLNESGEITYRPHGTRGTSSTIDLTFENPPATTEGAVKDWAINPELSYGSDHLAIQWTLDYGRVEIDNPAGLKYNYKEVEPKEWTATFSTIFGTKEEELAFLLNDDPCTDVQLEMAAATITNAIQETNEKIVPTRRPNSRARPWWNKDLSDATKEVNNLNAERANFENRFGFRNRQLQAKVKKARNFLKRLCKFQKAKWANQKLEEAHTKDIWGFRSWSKGTRNYPTPAISQGPNQPPAVTHAEKCDAIRNELFQPPPPLPTEFHTDLSEPHPDEILFEQVTTSEVQEALFNTSTKTAPGYSQTTYGTLRWAWSSAAGHITGLMRNAFRMGSTQRHGAEPLQ